jgi:hypothetical protein
MNTTNTTNNPSTYADTTPTRVYRVVATTCQAFCIYLEAESSNEAFDIAERVDGAFWQSYGPADWDIDHVELVVDTAAVKLLPEEVKNTL